MLRWAFGSTRTILFKKFVKCLARIFLSGAKRGLALHHVKMAMSNTHSQISSFGFCFFVCVFLYLWVVYNCFLSLVVMAGFLALGVHFLCFLCDKLNLFSLCELVRTASACTHVDTVVWVLVKIHMFVWTGNFSMSNRNDIYVIVSKDDLLKI